jgi:hypothetical protein
MFNERNFFSNMPFTKAELDVMRKNLKIMVDSNKLLIYFYFIFCKSS